MPGIFISRGMRLGVPAGGLMISIGEDGEPNGSLTLHVHFDVCPTWLELAERHLADAKERQAERAAAWASTDESAKAASLEREFEASMQAMMAAAIALDAFYAAIRKTIELPEDLVAAWKKNRTARPVQIAEALRIAFGLKPKGVEALTEILKQTYQLRDRAVHPASDLREAILHPELDVGVEWRFFYFRHHNAEVIVRNAAQVIHELVTTGRPKNEAVDKYARELCARLGLKRKPQPAAAASGGESSAPEQGAAGRAEDSGNTGIV